MCIRSINAARARSFRRARVPEVGGSVGHIEPDRDGDRRRAADRTDAAHAPVEGVLADLDVCVSADDLSNTLGNDAGSRLQTIHLCGPRDDLDSALPRKHGHRHHLGLDSKTLAEAIGDSNLRYVMLHIAARRDRAHIIADEHLGEPAWDILLDLFVAARLGRCVSILDACIAANVPSTTGLRHVRKLEESGLILRYADRSDRRRSFVRLSDEMMSRIEDWAARRSAA